MCEVICNFSLHAPGDENEPGRASPKLIKSRPEVSPSGFEILSDQPNLLRAAATRSDCQEGAQSQTSQDHRARLRHDGIDRHFHAGVVVAVAFPTQRRSTLGRVLNPIPVARIAEPV